MAATSDSARPPFACQTWRIGLFACLAVAGCLVAGACAAQNAHAALTSTAAVAQARHKYMILPFGDANDLRFRGQYPNAATIVRDTFESAFIDRGFPTISYAEDRTSNIIMEASRTYSKDTKVERPTATTEETHTSGEAHLVVGNTGISTADGMAFAKKAGADIVIFGTVTDFYRGWFGGLYTTVGFSVKAVDVNSGEILWKKSCLQSVKFKYNYDPAVYASELSAKIVEGLSAQP